MAMSGTEDAGPPFGIEASERSRSPLDEIVEPAAGRTLGVVVDDDGPFRRSCRVLPAGRGWWADEPRRGSSGRPRSCSRRTWTDSGPDLGRRLRSGSVSARERPGSSRPGEMAVDVCGELALELGPPRGVDVRRRARWSRAAAAPAASSCVTLIRIVGATVRSANGLP